MSVNLNTPYGLQPVARLDGATWNDSLRVYFVPAAVTHALFVGDPVIKTAGLADTGGINGVDLVTAGTGNQITGVVCGFLGACTAGAGAAAASLYGLPTGPLSRPATSAQDWYVLVNDDPEAQFYIQENDNFGGVAGTPMPVASAGKNANLIAGAGNAFTGWSGWMLDSNTPPGTGATLQLRIIGAVPSGNFGAPGAAFGKWIVQINDHTELPHQAGI